MHTSFSKTTVFLAVVCLSLVRGFTQHAARPASLAACFMSSSAVPPMPYSDDKMLYYALGVNMAMQIESQNNVKTFLEEKELDLFLEGFRDHLKGTEPVDARTILQRYGQAVNKILLERASQIVQRAKQEGKDFIANFLDSDEAKQTESGLVYCEITEGTGAQPTLQSIVEIHCHATYADGTVHDSSTDRGQTTSVPLSGVIKGFQEGLQLMKEGGKATLICPPDIAYGDLGSQEGTPPGATIIYHVELFKVASYEPWW